MRKLRSSKLKIPERDCRKLKNEEIDELIENVINLNSHHETGVWGKDTEKMRIIVAAVADLLSF